MRVTPYISSRIKEWRADLHMREVVSGSAVALVLKMVGVGLTFCFNLFLARTLGADGAGEFYLVLTVITIATVFGRIGLDNVLLRFVATNVAMDDWPAVKGVYQKGVSLTLVASIASTVVVFAVAPLLAKMVFRKPELINSLRWMSFAVVPMSLLIIHAEMLKGLKRIRDSLIVYGVGVPALSFFAFYFFGDIWGVNGAVWAYVIASFITAMLGVLLWWSATPQLRNITGHFKSRVLLSSSMPLFWVASLTMLINFTATFALGIWGTKADVGIFGVAYQATLLLSMILFPVNIASAPKFAALYKKGDIATLSTTIRRTTKLIIFMAVPVLLPFLFIPDVILGIFGNEFVKGAALLPILAIGQFVNVATGPVAHLLMMSGNEQALRNSVAFVALANILLNAALIPLFGIFGAAIATSICIASLNLMAAYQVRLLLNVWTIPLFK